MFQTGRQRPNQRQGWTPTDIACVAVVLLAVIGLVVWIVTHAGGGVFNLG